MTILVPPSRPLRVAQVAPLYETVPPSGYGGTERVVHYLTEELVRLGHEVTLFASGDSLTSAKLVPCCPRSLRLDPGCVDPLAHHFCQLEKVFQLAHHFDLIHFHIDYLHFPLSRRLGVPHVSTLHGRLDIPDLRPLYEEFADIPLVSISNAQRGPLPKANWQGTVLHGLPPDLFTFRPEPGEYLAFLGRFSPEKRPDRAIEMALRTGWKLRLAAKIDRADRDYFDSTIRPLLQQHPDQLEYIGEVNGVAKDDFLGRAAALLFPIDWPEPFGLVMIEALACGTPVIAYPLGAVPEVLDDGVTSFIVSDQEEAVRAVRRLPELSRHTCRKVFEQRFLARRMAQDYLEIYRRLLHWPGNLASIPLPLRTARALARPRYPATTAKSVEDQLSVEVGA